ncbi:MAG: hypothetical protein MJZ61_08240 [Bacteroidales bacterium]|nr:hypothetical protein [Bacteroidales bacterium]
MKHTLLLAMAIAAANPLTAQTSADPDQTVCAGSTFTYYIEKPVEGSSYTWAFSNQGIGQQINKLTPEKSDELKVEWIGEGICEISVKEISEKGCEGPESKISVRVKPKPTAEFSNAAVCFGENIEIEFTGEMPVSINYTLNDEPKPEIKIDKGSKYTLPYQPGKYQLTSITDQVCTADITSNNKTAAGQEMKPLEIKMKEN